MEKICLDCGKPLKGRADKKFCDDQCRSNFNNRQKTGDPAIVKKINLILKKNRGILDKLNPDGKIRLTKEKMAKAGFNFTYFTHNYKTKKETNYFFCYDHGYLFLENDMVLLVKNAEDQY